MGVFSAFLMLTKAEKSAPDKWQGGCLWSLSPPPTSLLAHSVLHFIHQSSQQLFLYICKKAEYLSKLTSQCSQLRLSKMNFMSQFHNLRLTSQSQQKMNVSQSSIDLSAQFRPEIFETHCVFAHTCVTMVFSVSFLKAGCQEKKKGYQKRFHPEMQLPIIKCPLHFLQEQVLLYDSVSCPLKRLKRLKFQFYIRKIQEPRNSFYAWQSSVIVF